jgi:hypothetical protein
MKFKDLEEGKKYKVIINNESTEKTIYSIKDKLLYVKDNLGEEHFSKHSHESISEVDFEEVIEYVSFEEAVKHMKKGGKAKFECVEYRIQNGCIGYGYDYFVSADMELVFFKPNWILK